MRTLIKISVFYISLLCVISCNRGETNMSDNSLDPEISNKQISISCESPFQKILLTWVEDFNLSHPNIQMIVQDSNSDLVLISENRVIESNDTVSWRVPVMREGIIPVVSDENPYLDVLAKQGISKEKLVKIFTGNQVSWGELLGNDAGEKVTVFLPEKGLGCSEKWADFLEISAESLQARRFSNMETILDSIKQNPNIIAVLNACCAYDPETNEGVEGIIALSMDLNNDGRIDSKEEISDDLCELERALYLGLHPPKLCSCIFLQADQKPEGNEEIIFIKWVLTEGQKQVVDHGFSIIRHSVAVKAIQDLEANLK